MGILNFEQFKHQQELDKDFPKFLKNAEASFEGKNTPESMFKRLYYTIRYLEGHIRGLQVLYMVCGITLDEQKRGTKLLIDWLQGILDDLKGFYNGD